MGTDAPSREIRDRARPADDDGAVTSARSEFRAVTERTRLDRAVFLEVPAPTGIDVELAAVGDEPAPIGRRVATLWHGSGERAP